MQREEKKEIPIAKRYIDDSIADLNVCTTYTMNIYVDVLVRLMRISRLYTLWMAHTRVSPFSFFFTCSTLHNTRQSWNWHRMTLDLSFYLTLKYKAIHTCVLWLILSRYRQYNPCCFHILYLCIFRCLYIIRKVIDIIGIIWIILLLSEIASTWKNINSTANYILKVTHAYHVIIQYCK